jgi:large subunit ribosomal protein L17
MIHARKGRKLNRTASHRKALLSALSTSLLRHKRIKTTLAKAKETRLVVEKLITRAKNAVAKETEGAKNVHARREVAKFIHDKAVVKELFNEIALKVAARPGGYTRVIKLGQRLGDGAHVAMIELVDYGYQAEAAAAPVKKKQDRRARISQKKKTKTEKPADETAVTAPAEQ